jgi:hypothetical protein
LKCPRRNALLTCTRTGEKRLKMHFINATNWMKPQEQLPLTAFSCSSRR